MFTTNAATIFLVAIPTMALLALLFFHIFRLIIAYEIADDRIKVLLFHIIPIYKVHFKKIEKMYTQRFHEVALVPGWHFPSRIFGKRVVFEMKDTWFMFAFLTPEDPDAFIAEVRKRTKIS